MAVRELTTVVLSCAHGHARGSPSSLANRAPKNTNKTKKTVAIGLKVENWKIEHTLQAIELLLVLPFVLL